jgi:hypothetical protein
MSGSKNDVGITGLIGTILAGYLSWITWHSIGWLIINGVFGWLYVIYWLIFLWHGQ